MDAEFELSPVDFRTTPVENIFLDTYLAEAPENALRVYLAGWKLCYSKQESEAETWTLSDFLGLSSEQIREAMQYWTQRRLVEPVAGRPDAWRFRSMLLSWAGIYDRQMTSDDIESTRAAVESAHSIRPERMSEGTEDSAPFAEDRAGHDDCEEMFDALEDFLSSGFSYQVTLKPNEILLIQDVMARYGLTPSYFLYAYQKAHAQNESSARSVNYLVAIVENWARFEGITTREALDTFLERENRSNKRGVRKSRPRRKKSQLAGHDTRMSRSEEQEWIRQKLEESRRLCLPEDSGREEEP